MSEEGDFIVEVAYYQQSVEDIWNTMLVQIIYDYYSISLAGHHHGIKAPPCDGGDGHGRNGSKFKVTCMGKAKFIQAAWERIWRFIANIASTSTTGGTGGGKDNGGGGKDESG
ncbi:hypothetical protein E2C01_012084 [Portunus trituberculatus]|uniref:Uncharacterized protein n=1 Tax=Portunus trituberculatus TaxID=210409 RepID=A0A5B7DDN6_PORTR|nr:hypothetical protein [Portunus trituberculatus]